MSTYFSFHCGRIRLSCSEVTGDKYLQFQALLLLLLLLECLAFFIIIYINFIYF